MGYRSITKYQLNSLTLPAIIISCSPLVKQEKKFYVTEIYEQGFLLTKDDSIQIEKHKIQNKKISDSCEVYKLNCTLDGGYSEAEFRNGINNFRNIVSNNFNLPKKSKESSNTLHLIIEKNDKIKSFTIENTKDERVRNELERILNLPETKQWKSASFNRNNLEYYLKLRVEITNK